MTKGMDRRDFVKYLALLAAGAAALPQQIAAFEQYYDLNTIGTSGLAAVDELMISGLGCSAIPAELNLWVGGQIRLPMGVNLFGGVLRWIAAPDQKIVAPLEQIKWQVKDRSSPAHSEEWLRNQFTGHISYIGQDGIRRNVPLLSCRGTLAS